MLRFPAILLFSLLVSGCATTEIINQVQLPKTTNLEQSELKVCRQRIFRGDAAATIISLDRRPILRSSAGKCFAAKILSGDHVLSVMTQGPAGLEVGELEFILQKNESRYFKIRFERILEVTAEEMAEFYEYEHIIVQ